jgi:hypothetical protein
MPAVNDRNAKRAGPRPDARLAHPDYSVYAVLPRQPDVLGQERPSYWAPIGAGWKNRDESITIKLELMPTAPGATIQLRPYRNNAKTTSGEPEP